MVEWKKLGDLFETRNGYTPSTKEDSFWVGGNVPWFKMDDIRDNGSVLDDSKLHITEKAIKGKGLFKANSIILATSATIGEHALITVDHLCNQRFTNISPKKCYESIVNMRFVYYYMFLVDEWCKQHTRQGGFASVDMDGLYKLPIPIPSLSEQTRIVGILDTFTASIDNLKEQIAQRRKQYEYYRDQLLDLEGKEGVEMKTLPEISNNCDRERKPITSSKRVSGIYPYYGASGIVDYVDSYIFDGDYLLISEDGANLLARTTPIAFSIKGKNWVNNHAHVLQFNDCVTQKFVEIYLNMINLEPWINGAAQPKLNQDNLNRIEIPVPSLSEQSRIVSILDTFEASIQNLEAQLKEREKQYEYYRNKLLTFEKAE